MLYQPNYTTANSTLAYAPKSPKDQFIASKANSTFNLGTDANFTGATSPASPAVNLAYKGQNVRDMGAPPSSVGSSPKAQFVSSQASTGGEAPAGYKNPNANYFGNTGGAPSQTVTGGSDTSTGAPTQPANSHYREAFSKYLSTLTQSSEEKGAREYLNRLISQSNQDQEKALGMGESLGFATGEAGRVGRQNSLAIDAATNALGAFTADRGGQTEAAKARLDFEKGMMEDSKPFDLGPGEARYALNPNTGQYEKVASGTAKDRQTSLTEVDGRRVLIDDQTGEIIKSLGGASSGGGGSVISLSADDKRGLLSAGFTQNEANAIEEDVRAYGIDKATEGMDQSQVTAIRKAFGGSSADDDATFITPEFLKTSFGSSSIEDMLSTLGKKREDYARLFDLKSTEEANIKKDFQAYVDTLYPIIEQYRAAGYTDKEILKMMQ